MAIVGVVIALAVGGTVWAITSSSNGNQATPPPTTTRPQGSATTTTTTTATPGASSTTSPVVTSPPTDTVRVPDVVTGTVVSSAEQILQGSRLQYMLKTQPVSACTLPSGAYNQNAVLWQMPSAGSEAAVGSQVTLGGVLTRLPCRAALTIVLSSYSGSVVLDEIDRRGTARTQTR